MHARTAALWVCLAGILLTGCGAAAGTSHGLAGAGGAGNVQQGTTTTTTGSVSATVYTTSSVQTTAVVATTQEPAANPAKGTLQHGAGSITHPTPDLSDERTRAGLTAAVITYGRGGWNTVAARLAKSAKQTAAAEAVIARRDRTHGHHKHRSK